MDFIIAESEKRRTKETDKAVETRDRVLEK